MRIWSDNDADAARVMTSVWKWRIYAIVAIAFIVVLITLISRV